MSDLIPRKVFFGNPDRASVQVSPDGKYISYVAPFESVLNIFIAPISDISNAQAVTFDKGRGIRSYYWSISGDQIIYSQDKDGDEDNRLFILDLESKASKQITPDGVKAMFAGRSDRIPNEILFVKNERNDQYFDLFSYNLKTGESKLVYKNDQYINLTSDKDFKLRFGSKNLPNGDVYIEKILSDGSTEHFKTVKFEDMENSGIHSINSLGNKVLMYDSENRDKAALFAINLEDGSKEVIASNDKSDMSGILLHPTSLEPQAVSYVYDRMNWKILDDSIRPDFENIAKFADGDFSIISRSLDSRFWIIADELDNSPLKYYLYDKSRGSHEFLFTQKSVLEKYKLNNMHSVAIKTRDDVNMVSYLTVPSNVHLDNNFNASAPAPLVLYVHGGPTARDYWGYNAVHQWLSNRGYAVLSVNYRGSSGFGKEHIRKGDGQWAGKMHEDLLDAVSWAISRGITTKDKVAIMGGSYGGYATLVGLTMTPDVFACGIDIVGVSNVQTLYESMPSYWKPAISFFRRMVGLEVGSDLVDSEYLAKISPLTYVDNISKPLLIAHGANDPRVKKAESDQIVAKMKEKNIPYTYLLYPNEGHGFARPENRTSFNAYAEEFLANCFNMNYEPIGNDLEGSSVIVDKVSK